MRNVISILCFHVNVSITLFCFYSCVLCIMYIYHLTRVLTNPYNSTSEAVTASTAYCRLQSTSVPSPGYIW